MSLGTWGWLVLAFPLAGAIVCALLYRAPNTKLTGYMYGVRHALPLLIKRGSGRS